MKAAWLRLFTNLFDNHLAIKISMETHERGDTNIEKSKQKISAYVCIYIFRVN
jgi:hypothetical protein